MIQANKIKPKPKRKPIVFFVDDDPYWRKPSINDAREIGLRARGAISPNNARTIIAKRLDAIDRLEARLRLKLSKTKSVAEQREIKLKLQKLLRMKKSPFDLIVSDINMPAGVPSGIKFVDHLTETYPKQRIVLQSDDARNIKHIRTKQFKEHGKVIPYIYKLSDTYSYDFKDRIEEELGKKRRKKPFL